MQSPNVSVIIPAYNSERFLARALNSVNSQTYTNFEILVIDDGSTDHTAEIVKRYPNVKYLYQENKGDAAARNLGVLQSHGELLAFLDSDDLWMTEKLEKQVRVHTEDERLLYTLTHEICVLEAGVPRPGWVREEHFTTPHVGVLSTMMARRCVFDQVGLFNETMPVASDMEWFSRARALQAHTVTIPHLLTERRIHKANMSYDHINQNNSMLLKAVRGALQQRRTRAGGGSS